MHCANLGSMSSVAWISRVVIIVAGVFPAVAQEQPAAPKPAAAAKPAAPAKPPLEPGLYATMTTSMGPIVLKLYEKESPITVKNFVGLATGQKEYLDPRTRQKSKQPLYNGLTFHRVIPGFMIQGGDPLGNGMGGTEAIRDEFHPSLQFDKAGILAMANAGPNTGSSQFFITDGPTPHLDGKHTIFGQVVDGLDVVEKIARVPRNPANDKPNTPVRIVRVSIRRVGPGPAVSSAPAKPKPATSAVKPAGTKPAAAKPSTPAPKSPAASKPPVQ